MKRGLIFTLLLILGICQVRAEDIGSGKMTEPDSVVALELEHVRTHRHFLIMTGESIRYEVHSSFHFEKGKIAEITDSTISFQHADMKIVKLAHKDLETLVIPRGTGRKGFGFATMAIPTSSIAFGLSLNGSDAGSLDSAAGFMFCVGGAMGLINAHVLLRGKRFILKSEWMVKRVKVVMKK